MKKSKKGKQMMDEEIMEKEPPEAGDDSLEEGEKIEVEVVGSEDTPEDKKEDKEQEKSPKEKEYFDRLVRVTADLDNYKKRVLKEKQEFLKYCNERLVKEIIPVIDNLERAIESAKSASEAKSITAGIELIYNQIMNILKREGVTVIESNGGDFDPLIHEAISHIPSNEHPQNTIIEEQLKAYLLNKKLVRAAKVVVSSGPSPETSQDTESKEEEALDEEKFGDSENE